MISWKRFLPILVVTVAVVLVALAFLGAQSSKEEAITPNKDFFNVSIGPSPVIDATNWTLIVDGTVNHPLNLTYGDIIGLNSVTEPATVKCVTGPSARAVWTGVPLRTILDMAGLKSSSQKVIFHCADGYSSDLRVLDARVADVLLAYGMNNESLPVDQGYPLRLVVPDNYGYKWAKWIVHVEVVDYDYKGYWESQGWADNAQVTPQTDWWYHAALLSVAAVFGTFSALSGLSSWSQRVKAGYRLPRFSPAFHRYAGLIFAILTIAVFIFWSIQTYDFRGSIFYTIHGQLALIAVLMETGGLITGVLLIRGRVKLRELHWGLTILGYLLIIAVIITGLWQAFG